MTDPDDCTEPDELRAIPSDVPAPGDRDEGDDGSIRELLRGVVSQPEPPQVSVLRGVQSKIRQRSRGKYFADGWSTTRQPPVATFLVTSLVMLAVMLFVYLVLSPLSGDAARVEPPAPVNVVPPATP